jgi:hypothetical protein
MEEAEMAEESITSKKKDNRFARSVAVLMALVTLWGAIVAYLQTTAATMETQSVRDSQALAIQVTSALQENSLQSEHDLRIMADWLAHAGLSLVDQAVVLTVQGTAGEELMQYYTLEGQINEDQAQALIPQSALLSDPRYAISLTAGNIDQQRYLQDRTQQALDLEKKQNAAADAAELWGSKSNAYSSILALLTVGLFFLGLSLVPEDKTRLVFLGMGLLVAVVDMAWTLVVLLG